MPDTIHVTLLDDDDRPSVRLRAPSERIGSAHYIDGEDFQDMVSVFHWYKNMDKPEPGVEFADDVPEKGRNIVLQARDKIFPCRLSQEVSKLGDMLLGEA